MLFSFQKRNEKRIMLPNTKSQRKHKTKVTKRYKRTNINISIPTRVTKKEQ